MRRKTFARIWFTGALMIASTLGHAADKQPIGRKLDNAAIMERVQLVGVIAGGSGKNAGIAVIKDAQTGRTYAIKTGDNLPGVEHIRLDRVQRELAVFTAEGKEFHVRLAVGGYAQQADDEDDLTADLDKTGGSGLFETWYGEATGEGAELVKEQPSKPEVAASETVKIKSSANSMISGVAAVPAKDAPVEARREQEGHVVKYLEELTAPRSEDDIE